uniref:Pre-mRNA-processing factor 40 homolog A n=1 Tax=Zeugodacus cucurbitae TaxID=28588 RepID=A0A0A1XRU0_ZEUCU
MAENKMISNAKTTEDLAVLVKKWIEDFKNLDLSELSQTTNEVLRAKYKIAQRIAKKLKQGAKIPTLENITIHWKRESVAQTWGQLHVWEALSEISDLEIKNNMMRVISTREFHCKQTDIATLFSPEPIPMKIKGKNTQRSIGKINGDSRKRMLSEGNSEANAAQSNSSTSTQSADHAASSSRASTSVQAPISLSGDDDGYTVIGPNGTKVPTEKFRAIPFMIPCAATRTLICLVFSEEVLAANTLSGKPSPAFLENDRVRPPKGQLDPKKVEDIIHCITTRTFYSSKEVRMTITLKCSMTAKKVKNRLNKSGSRAN